MVSLVINRVAVDRDPDVEALADNVTNGLYARTGNGQGVGRTLLAEAGLEVENGSGVNGNPKFTLEEGLQPLREAFRAGNANKLVRLGADEFIDYIEINELTVTPTGESSGSLADVVAARARTAGDTFTGTVAIVIPPGSTSKAINTDQVGPSTSQTGPLVFNQMIIVDDAPLSGDGRSIGLLISYDIEENKTGAATPLFLNLNQNVDTDTGGDKWGFASQAVVSAVDTSAGEHYGITTAALAESGADITALAGVESDVRIATGVLGCVRRWAFRAVNDAGTQQADNQDCAYGILSSNHTGGRFKTGFLISTQFGTAPIATTGEIFGIDAAQTVANVLNFANLTVTGYIANFPGLTISGAGQQVLIGATPSFTLRETDGSTDEKDWTLAASGEIFRLTPAADAGGGTAAIQIERSGSTPIAIGIGCTMIPLTDDVYDLGHPSFRFDDVYATNTTIQSSDERLKTPFRRMSEAERRAILKAVGAGGWYRWLASVEEKGDAAREHFGVSAQWFEACFAEEGLDPYAYGILCVNQLEEEVDEQHQVLVEEQVMGDDGEPVYDEIPLYDDDGQPAMTERPVHRTVVVQKQIKQAVMRTVVSIEDGKPVARQQEVKEPVWREEVVRDTDGNPVPDPKNPGADMVVRVPVTEPVEKTVRHMERVQETKRVPRMATVARTKARRVRRPVFDEAGEPVTRMSIRYTELMCAWACAMTPS